MTALEYVQQTIKDLDQCIGQITFDVRALRDTLLSCSDLPPPPPKKEKQKEVWQFRFKSTPRGNGFWLISPALYTKEEAENIFSTPYEVHAGPWMVDE